MGDVGDYWRDINEARKEERTKRKEILVASFKCKLLPKLNKNPLILKIEEPLYGQYSLHTQDHGIVDIFVNTGSLRVRKGNQWFYGYKKWLKLNNYI